MTTLDAYATFLTARWDEVEDAHGHYPVQPSDWGDFDTPTGGCVPCDVRPPAECYVLADLAAKRAILEEMGDMDDPPSWVLNLLADPFRDHPDHPANQEA